jgi:hypothetical protein
MLTNLTNGDMLGVPSHRLHTLPFTAGLGPPALRHIVQRLGADRGGRQGRTGRLVRAAAVHGGGGGGAEAVHAVQAAQCALFRLLLLKLLLVFYLNLIKKPEG